MNKKIVALVLACVLIFSTVVAGTLAYLQVKTNPVVNTFTFGNVDLTLAETTGTSYKIVPGNDIPKDPKVTVSANSENCWVFVKVEENSYVDTFLTYAMAEGWTQLKNGEDDVEGVFYREVNTSTQAQDFKVLNGDKVTCINVAKNVVDTAIAAQNTPELSFTAYAIQKDGFTTALAAWGQAQNL